jgi:hypothetical protein
MTNSLMKDYFDLWVLLGDTDLDPIELKRAIGATFIRRKTARLAKVPVGWTDDFSADIGKQIQWRAFLKKNQLKPVDLNEVVQMLRNNFQKIGVI